MTKTAILPKVPTSLVADRAAMILLPAPSALICEGD